MVVENKGVFYPTFRGKKIRQRNWIYEIECVIKHVIDERRLILEKIRKNNYQIWTLYDGETPGAIFNSRLKREISTIRVFISINRSNFNCIYIMLLFRNWKGGCSLVVSAKFGRL